MGEYASNHLCRLPTYYHISEFSDRKKGSIVSILFGKQFLYCSFSFIYTCWSLKNFVRSLPVDSSIMRTKSPFHSICTSLCKSLCYRVCFVNRLKWWLHSMKPQYRNHELRKNHFQQIPRPEKSPLV